MPGTSSVRRRPAPRSGRTVPYRRRRNFRAARFLLFRPSAPSVLFRTFSSVLVFRKKRMQKEF